MGDASAVLANAQMTKVTEDGPVSCYCCCDGGSDGCENVLTVAIG